MSQVLAHGLFSIVYCSLLIISPIGGASMHKAVAGAEVHAQQKGATRIVLVGASIGKAWDFPKLPERQRISGFTFEYVGVPDHFDKSTAINQILQRPNRPEFVIIKECSVFFPGDINEYKRLIQTWVNELKGRGIVPILATTVPFAEPNGLQYRVKRMAKLLLGEPDKFEQIATYNDWLREYGKMNRVPILDLEAALRVSDGDRHMDSRYNRGDYTHLNASAYHVLDKITGRFVEGLRRNAPATRATSK
jgi:hypothetical protein